MASVENAGSRCGNKRFISVFAVEAVFTDNYEADLVVNTERFTKIVEEIIREHPEQ
jgi:hypothetical protein